LFLKKVDIVLHIAGIKGSPSRTASSPADYLFPMTMFNTNMIKASFDANVDWFVYMSSVGVYAPADVMEEDSVWTTMPSKNDWHPGWTKRMGELALDALRIQHNWTKWTVIRPSNIYGVNDKFTQDATVIGANIWKLFNMPGDMVCWGNGTARRDFVFGDDVAQAAIDVVKKEVNDVINFGCGEAVTIKETIETIVEVYTELTNKTKNIVWDETKPNGDLLRCLSSKKQERYGILPTTSLKEGIRKTMSPLINDSHNRKPRDFSSLFEKGYYIGHLDEILLNDKVKFKKNIDTIKKLSENKEKYYNYRHSVNGPSNLPHLVPVAGIEQRRQTVIEQGLTVSQQWYEMMPVYEPNVYEVFHEILDTFITEIYPELDPDKKNLYYKDNITLYEDGDFICRHRDGDNPGRLCAILIYLSSPEDYNDGGGRLFVSNDEVKEEVLPLIGNYVILDFTKHNVWHEVEEVKNGFKRFSYLGFAYNLDKDPNKNYEPKY
jgi:GDP-L-fucose synthase